MGLQVRLRHALGERVVEIPPRAVDDPVVVGRAGNADVQVPSINVGPQHAVVFVHDGQWVVQDCSADYATYVNGEPLSGPRPLSSGDVIVLGTDANAPMIEVDPDGITLGHAGDPAAGAARAGAVAPARGGPAYAGAYPSAAAPPPPPPPAPPRPSAVPGYPPASRMIATGPRVAYSVPEQYEVGEDPHARERELHAQQIEDPWAAATASGATRRRPRRQQKTSEAAIAFAVVAGIAIVGVVVYLVYQKRQQEDPAPVVARVEAKKAPVIDTGPAKRVPKSIFTDDGAPLPNGGKPPKTGYDRLEDTENLKRPAPLPDITDDQPPRTSEEAAPRKGVGKGKSAKEPAGAGADDDDVISETDPTFRRVENAYYSPNPAKALLTFQAYEEEFPDKHTKRIADYREAMLDKIWWDRVESLVEKRQKLTQGIKETQLAIKEETEEAHKVTVLEPRLDEQKSRLASIGEKLVKEMGWKLTTPPPITDEAAMADLRARRDNALYEPWKKRVLKHILDKHGDYPWANEK